MKFSFKIFLAILLALGVCFGGMSCGPKPKPKPSSTKKPKKEPKKKEPPKPVVEERPALPPKPPLPQDLSQWGRKEFYRAREEGNPRLDEACELLGAPFENKPSAASAVEILRSILTPLPIPEMPEIPKPVYTEDTTPQEKNKLEREYKRKVKEQEDKIRSIPTLNSRTIAAIIEILGQNGDDAAWKLMVDLVQRRQTVDDESDIERNIVQTILSHPRSNNLDLIYQMITQPGVFLKPVIPPKDEKRRITTTQVRTMAIEWMKKNSDPEFRERVADYIIAHPEDRELYSLAVPYLISGLAGNIQCMHKIYMAPNLLDPNNRDKVERYFLDCSTGAFASVTNQAAMSGKPDPADVQKVLSLNPFLRSNEAYSSETPNAESDQEQSGQAEETAQNPDDNQNQKKSWKIEPYQDTQINDSFRMMAYRPQYATMILDVVWQNEFIARQKQTWENSLEFRNRDKDANTRFLLALPLVGQRQYWSEYFTTIYQDGPANMEKSPLMGYMPVDFGLLLELKKIKRNVLPPAQQKRPISSRQKINPAKERQIALQAEWMEFVRRAVKMQMERCLAAAAVQKALNINVDNYKSRVLFTLPEDAHIISEYHMVLPNERTSDIQGIQIDPVEVHFVQFQWDGPAGMVFQKVKYGDSSAKLRFNTANSSDRGALWFEYTNPECTESMDIRVPVVGQTKEDQKEPAKGYIQVLSIRTHANN